MKQLMVSMVALVFSLGGTALAHCPHADSIMEGAHELSEASEHFHELIHDISGYTHLSAQAHQLATVVDAFHGRIHTTDPSCREIRRAFRRVEDSYFGLKRAFRHAHDLHHDLHAEEDFQEVVNAYRAVERRVYSSL